MRLLWVELRDFRNHRLTKVAFGSGLTTVLGDNGEGKTNLLEGICFLLTLASPRVSSDQPLVRHGAEAAYVRGEVETAEGTVLIEVEVRETGANRVQVDHAPVRRKRDLRRRVRAVFFGPDDLSIVQGEPGARRRFMDDVVVGLWPNRETELRNYEKILRQRNRLLKDHAGQGVPSGLEVWNQELVAAGSAVTRLRAQALASVVPGADANFSHLANYGLGIAYRPSVQLGQGDGAGSASADAIDATFRRQLAEREVDELQRRTTLVGPHRDDLGLQVRDLTARAFASYGEAWAAALSLRAGLGSALEAEVGDPPVRLYDDPFAALDPDRRSRLGEALASTQGQVIVSTPDITHVPTASAAVIEIAAGAVVQASATPSPAPGPRH